MSHEIKLQAFDLKSDICGRDFDVADGEAIVEGRLQVDVPDGQPLVTVYPNRDDLVSNGYLSVQYSSRVTAIESVHDDDTAKEIIDKVFN